MNNFVNEYLTCNICGKTFLADEIEEYGRHVYDCSKQEKAAREEQKIQLINQKLNGIKEAEKYLKDLKESFKTDFPEEYEKNFGSKKAHKKPVDNHVIKDSENNSIEKNRETVHYANFYDLLRDMNGKSKEEKEKIAEQFVDNFLADLFG